MQRKRTPRENLPYRPPLTPEEAWEQPVYQARPMAEEAPYPAYAEAEEYAVPGEEESPYLELPPEEAWEETWEEAPAPAPVIATNATVKLTCTLAAFCSLLALFFVFAEKRSRAIRHFSVQSLGVTALHLAGGILLLLLGSLLGGIPFLGFLISITCWLLYIALILACVFLRVRMMSAAYQGLKYTLPVIGERLELLFGGE